MSTCCSKNVLERWEIVIVPLDIYVLCVLYQYNNIAHSIFIVMYDEDFLKASWYDETQSFSR